MNQPLVPNSGSPPGPEWERAHYPGAPDDLIAWLYPNRDLLRRALASDLGQNQSSPRAPRRARATTT